MKHTLFALVALLLAASAPAQNTQRLSASKANDYGIAYSLPLTALDITIEAEITARQPGEFAKYASKFLNINNPILEPSTSVKVKSAVINTVGVPNRDERYLVTLKGGFAPYVILSPDNIPLAFNTEKTLPASKREVPVARDAEPTPLETPAARQVITQEMMQSRSSAKRAELAAEQIYALRQSRTDLITGQAEQTPPDGVAMQLALDNINAQEQALMAMFVGTVSVRTVVRTIRVLPDADISNSVIARVSAANGIIDADDLSGAPVYLNLKVTDRGQLPTNDRGEQLAFPKGGVAYCIPGKARAEVKFDGKVIDSATVDMAQFGVVYGMNPANFTDKKAPICLIFDPTTGAAAEVGPVER